MIRACLMILLPVSALLLSGCAFSVTGQATANMDTGINFKGTQTQSSNGDPMTSAGGAVFTSNSLSAPLSGPAALAGGTPGAGQPHPLDAGAAVSKTRRISPSVPMPPSDP